jgi:hypothetical protein
VLAFLKRRWILLSCAVVLLACSCFSLHRTTDDDGEEWISRAYFGRCAYGLAQGTFFFYSEGDFKSLRFVVAGSTHRPYLGKSPEWRVRSAGIVPRMLVTSIHMPLWLPLSVALGWLVFREVRWREKRAKLAEASPTQ